MESCTQTASLAQAFQSNVASVHNLRGAVEHPKFNLHLANNSSTIVGASSQPDHARFRGPHGHDGIDIVDRFAEGLENVLGRGPSRLRNADFIRLTDFCRHSGREDYGQRPRTLAVLKWTGCIDAIDGFVRDRLSDWALPYTERNLPQYVKGQQMRSLFLENQKYVLASKANDLETPEGQHLSIERDGLQFFDNKGELGRGGFGIVYHVMSRLSLKQYALKCIPRGHSFKCDQAQIQLFANELKALKGLKHKHLVKLIGSYTDHQNVGLLMTPVADMNLARYLALPDLQNSGRADCLRRFFGCLAAGVEYLHSKSIRHKDIKPLNVLVMRHTGRVLLADFGTSRNWANEPSSSSHGTVRHGYTERYCAPEVSNSARRNWSTDIWSLGCIFLEMISVLSNLTVEQMQLFFETNGNGRQTVRENPNALQAWCQKIRKQASSPSDLQMLDLTLRMLHPDPLERPTASQIAAEIIDFSGPVPYHCGCLDSNSSDALSYEANEDTKRSSEAGEYDALAPKPLPTAFPHTTQDLGRNLWAGYKPPRIQEIREDMTVLHYDTAGEAVVSLQNSNQQEGSVPRTISVVDTALMTAIEPLEGEATSKWMEDVTMTYCQWPNCSSSWPVDNRDPFLGQLLAQHYRTAHGCHEFGPHLWLIKSSQSSHEELFDKAKTMQLVPATTNAEDANGVDPIVAAVRSAKLSRQARRAQEIAAGAEFASDEFGHAMPMADPPGRRWQNRPEIASTTARFDLLPDDRRPTPAAPPGSSQAIDEDLQLTIDDAFLPDTWSFLTNSRSREYSQKNNIYSPESSFVPSYHLAASNRFSRQEIDRALMSEAKPLFVYGTLMFPGILYSCANFYTAGTGIYDSRLQRRLQTTGADWAHADESIKSAAQCMTPAIICAGDTIRPKQYPWAITRLDSLDFREVEVHGFLILGLSEEAYRCLTHWLSEEMPVRLGFENMSESPQFRRQNVSAEIQQTNSRIRTVHASTFASTEEGYNLWSPTLLSRRLSYRRGPRWDRDAFVRSHSFTTLCKSGWEDHEKQLAKTMKMRCLMRGDALAVAVIQDNRRQIRRIIRRGCDIDAQCHQYGTAVQAAATTGHLDIVEELVNSGANVNIKNGSFGSPLIAACVHGHTDVARCLLKNGADVLAEGGRHINALYQAVSLSDVELAHLLLERGAWLIPNYGEILDLAEETGSRDMARMLEDYDVRGICKSKLISQEPRERRESRVRRTNSGTGRMSYMSYDERLALEKNKSSSMMQAVMLEAISLRGKGGKWTGIKAVRVLRLAIAHGAPPSIIDEIAPALKDFTSIIESLNGCQRQLNRLAQSRSDDRTRRGSLDSADDASDSISSQSRSRSRLLARTISTPASGLSTPALEALEEQYRSGTSNQRSRVRVAERYEDPPPPYPASSNDLSSSRL